MDKIKIILVVIVLFLGIYILINFSKDAKTKIIEDGKILGKIELMEEIFKLGRPIKSYSYCGDINWEEAEKEITKLYKQELDMIALNFTELNSTHLEEIKGFMKSSRESCEEETLVIIYSELTLTEIKDSGYNQCISDIKKATGN